MPYVTPGVYSKEEDLSLYVPSLSTTITGLVVEAHSGPHDEVVDITSQTEFVEKFGLPTTAGGRAAMEYLREGTQLKVVRVTGSGAVANFATAADVTPDDTITFTDKQVSERVTKVIISDSPFSGIKLSIEIDGELVEQFDELADKAAILAISSSNVTITDADPSALDPEPVTLTLASGSLGASPDKDDVIGTVSGDSATGMQLFGDPLAEDLNLLIAPGFYEAEVFIAGDTVVQSRGDAFYIHDAPQGLSTSEVIDFHNGEGAYDGLHAAFNSSYSALYWDWHEVYDAYTKSKVWVPSSVPMAGIIARNDNQGAVWTAPAGPNRGKAERSLNLGYSPRQAQIDLLYGNGNSINPFIKQQRQGIYAWGQRTLQRKPSALDRINVRRMLLYARKLLATASQYLVMEPNIEETWATMRSLARQVLNPIVVGGGLKEFRIICDKSTNTDLLQDQKRMAAKVLLKPVQVAEVITINWTTLSSGAEFSEFI